jgi:formylglycine-generating enzyme required for sulfatase activity
MTASIPQIFISATTGDLGPCRLRIVDAVSRQRCYAASQHHFAPTFKEVHGALREAIEGCDAMIHIVGECYGFEPRKRQPDEPRQSYTQMECSIARSTGIPVFVFLCKNGFPYQPHEPETDEKRELQLAYRRRIEEDEDNLYTEVATPDELEIRVIEALQNFTNRRATAAAAAGGAAAGAGAGAAAAAAAGGGAAGDTAGNQSRPQSTAIDSNRPQSSSNAAGTAAGIAASAPASVGIFKRLSALIPAWVKPIPPLLAAAVIGTLVTLHYTKDERDARRGTAGDSGFNAPVAIFEPEPNWEGPVPQTPWEIPDLGKLRMRWIPAGTFTMGSPETEPERDSDEVRRQVRISRPFWLGRTEVTQAQYAAIMGVNPSVFKPTKTGTVSTTGGTVDDLPVEYVSWEDAMLFCKKLNERERKAGRLPPGYAYTLPTDAEWEYACRAGTNTPFAGTGKLDEMGWHWGNSGRATHPVAKKKSNKWGLFDMHGNVWEWCLDYSDTVTKGNATDPIGEVTGATHHFIRGGGYFDVPRKCRAAFHDWNFSKDRYLNIGFRLALSPNGAAHQ